MSRTSLQYRRYVRVELVTHAASFGRQAGLAALLQGQYDKQEDFRTLNQRLEQLESKRKRADRIFYLSIPPTIFTAVAGNAASAASSQ